MFLGIHFLAVLAINAAATYLIGALTKPKTEDVEGELSPTGLGQGIESIFNEYVIQGKIIAPNNKDDAFKNKGSGDKKTLRGYYTCVVSGAEGEGIELRGLQLNGHAKVDYGSADRDSLSQSEKDKIIAKSNEFMEDHADWREGTADQPPQAYWVSKRGYDNVNAHRGIATITFRNVNLTGVGAGTLVPPKVFCRTKKTYTIGDCIQTYCRWAGMDLTKVDTSELDGAEMGGFRSKRDGNSYLSEVEELASMYFFYPVDLKDGTTAFRTLKRPEITLDIPIEDLGVVIEGDKPVPNIIRSIKKPETLPSQIALKFGVNGETAYSEIHHNATRTNLVSMTTALNISRAEAEVIANKLLEQIWVRRTQYSFQLDFEYKPLLVPGDVVTLAGKETVQISSIDRGANLILSVKAYAYDADTLTYGNAGSIIPATTNVSETPIDPDLLDFPTYDPNDPNNQLIDAIYHVLDIPTAHEAHGEKVFYALCDRQDTDLLISRDGGLTYNTELTFDEVQTFGSCDSVLGAIENSNLTAADLPLIDTTNTLLITLESGALSSLNSTQFANQEQMLFVGKLEFGEWKGEYLVASQVADLGNNQYQLSNFQRGLRGTEGYIHTHTSGESIFLIDDDTPRITLTTADLGKTFFFKPQVSETQDIAATASTSVDYVGKGLQPYAPTDVTYSTDADGNIIFNLHARDRFTFTTGETSENYEIDLLDVTSSVVRTISGQYPVYNQADIATDALGTDLDFNVYKISSLVGRSTPGYWLDVQTSGASQTVGNSDSSSFLGFKNITDSHTLIEGDKNFWLLINATDPSSVLTLPNLSADGFRCMVQNVGTEIIDLSVVGTIKVSEEFLIPDQTLELAQKSVGVWHGFLGQRQPYDQTQTHDTPSLAQGASADFDLDLLTNDIFLTSVSLSVAGRLRIYTSAGSRTADVADVNTDASSYSILDFDLSTSLSVSFLQALALATPDKKLYCRAFNNSGAASVVTVTVDYKI